MGASRNIVCAWDRATASRFSALESAPPPSATTVSAVDVEPNNNSCNAALSLERKPDSPASSKICAMERPSRAAIRSSRSTKRVFKRFASNLPTLVLPAPIKPTSKITRRPDCGIANSSSSAVVNRKSRSLALLDADCTTEGMELNRGGTRVGKPLEGLSRLRFEAGMGLLLERKIVLHRAVHRLGFHFDGGAGRERDVDGTGM